MDWIAVAFGVMLLGLLSARQDFDSLDIDNL